MLSIGLKVYNKQRPKKRVDPMRMTSRLLIAGCLGLFAASPVWAHLIIFKDGFMLQGDVRQPGANIEGIRVSEGTFVLDADARRVFFPHAQVEEVIPESNRNADLVTLETKVFRLQAPPVDVLERIFEISAFDENCKRAFGYMAGAGRPER